jgi:HAD superfamily hydrolase (TIGR01490 family)
MMKSLYCFDFDGTLTTHDTLFLFLKFYNKKRYYVQYIKHIPLFLLCKLKIIPAEHTKKNFIRSILGGVLKEQLQEKASDFFREKHAIICREKAVGYIENIDRSETDCFMVTASLDIWVKPFSDHFNMELVSTEAKYENNIFTGDFSTKNCTGKEKVIRIKQAIVGKKYKQTVAFGDSDGDREMMAWADTAHYRLFH